MSISNPLIAEVKLRPHVSVIPKTGLKVPRTRVELATQEKPDLGWISELNVLGELPWYRGEKRKVEVRIMTNEFRDYVVKTRPSLLVRRGSEIIGDLDFSS